MNSQTLSSSADISHDGSSSTTPAADAYGYELGYYTNDYNPIGGAAYTAFGLKYTSATGDITGQSLYNGNITNTTVAISQLNSNNPVGYTYHYDQLNRLKTMRQHTGISGTSWDRSSITPNYQENVTYDGNGNILTYGRNGAAPTAQTIDSLTYNYSRTGGRLKSNKLQSINDAIATSNYALDLTNQTSTTNYRYDAIGNLIYDAQSLITGNDGVNAITWSVYGKIQSIYKTTGTISYTYNPAGQRVSKTAAGLTTYYIRDAQGNTLGVYDNAHSTNNWKEQQLYGSSRLGLWTPNVNLTANNAIAVWDTIGGKQYELDNHLGNVLATISDKRLQHTASGTAIDYFNPDVVTAQDYYPFGMLQPGRQYTFANTYRYGFNGKENDNEVKGVGNQQDYGMRIYDPRVGRFLSTDPLFKDYPWYSSYLYAGNMPIRFIDIDGKEQAQPRFYFEPIKWDGTPMDYLKVIPNAATGLVNGVISLLWMANDGIQGATTTLATGDLPFTFKDIKQSFNQTSTHVAERWQDLKNTKFSDALNYTTSPQGLTDELQIGFTLYTLSRPVLQEPAVGTIEQGVASDIKLTEGMKGTAWKNWQDRVVSIARNSGLYDQVVEQVSFKLKDGIHATFDAIGRKGNNFTIIDAKSGAGALSKNQQAVLDAWSKGEEIYPVGDNAKGIFGDLTNKNVTNNIKKTEVWTRPVPK